MCSQYVTVIASNVTLPFCLCMIIGLPLISFVPDISPIIPKLPGGYIFVVYQ